MILEASDFPTVLPSNDMSERMHDKIHLVILFTWHLLDIYSKTYTRISICSTNLLFDSLSS